MKTDNDNFVFDESELGGLSAFTLQGIDRMASERQFTRLEFLSHYMGELVTEAIRHNKDTILNESKESFADFVNLPDTGKQAVRDAIAVEVAKGSK